MSACGEGRALGFNSVLLPKSTYYRRGEVSLFNHSNLISLIYGKTNLKTSYHSHNSYKHITNSNLSSIFKASSMTSCHFTYTPRPSKKVGSRRTRGKVIKLVALIMALKSEHERATDAISFDRDTLVP